MTDATHQPSQYRGLYNMLLFGVVLALSVAAVGLRLYHLDVHEIGYDEGVYWQTLRSMSAGHALYRDIFYSQPPFFVLSVFPAYASFGSSLWSARLSVALISLFGFLGAFLLGKALAGRLGAIAALLLLAVEPLYLAQSQSVQAEVPSAAFSLLAMGLAYLWWEHPEHPRGTCYAGLAGMTLAFSISSKLLGVSLIVPLGLLVVARLWQMRRQPKRTRMATSVSITTGVAASALTFAVLLLPFAGSWQSMVQDVITFHIDAARMYGNSEQVNVSKLQIGLASFLALAALFGILGAFLRRDWRVIPLIAWQLATLGLLWRLVPLFRHHFVALTPPLIALAIMGVGNPFALRPIFGSAALARLVTWASIALIVAAAISDARQDALRYRTDENGRAASLTHLKVAVDLKDATTSEQLVVTDAQFIAGLADRSTPPALADTSNKRINSGYLTLSELESATADAQVHAVLFFTGRFYLPNVAPFRAWVSRRFRLLHNYGGGKELWVR